MAGMQIRELSADQTASAFEAMRALRGHLTDSAEFTARVGAQRGDGYRLVAVFDDDGEHARAVCGFRVSTNLAWGRHLYIDDLSTLPAARGSGYAGALLTWVHDEAARLGCEQVHLDSGVQPERESAHRLYFAHRYRISSYHFQRGQ